MKNFKSMLAFVLAMILVVGCLPLSAFATSGYQNAYGFVDFPTGWSQAAMTDAVENGLITGYGDSTVRPKQLLTRAEMAAIMNRAFGAEIKADITGKYSDVTPDKWYYEEMAKAVNMRTFSGYEDGTMHPENPITRQEAVLVIARALVINAEDPHLLDGFVDKNDIGDFAKGAIASFVLRGYLHGYEDSTVRPNNYITREEFAQIMFNIFAAYVRAGGSVTVGDSQGEVILTGDNVHLYSSVIDGDLIIGDGVGATNVTLENVIIKGRIVFRGGEGLVTLRNVTKDDLIVTNDFNGTVNFNHYSDEAYFKNAVYNTPASFLDRTVPGGTASGTGLGNHDTYVEGRVDAGTGEEKKPTPSVVNPAVPGGGGTVTKYYDITFHPDNGDGTSVIEDIKQGKSLKQSGKTLPADPTKAGYKFAYWYYASNGREKVFTEDTVISSDMHVYAKWNPTVAFFTDNTFATQFGDSIALEAGGTLGALFPTAVPTKDGYNFVKWVYEDGNGPMEFTKDTLIFEYTKVYAEWEEIVVPPTKHTVTFYDDVNGNVFGTPIEAEEGKALGDNFPTATPTKEGYTFVKWESEGVEFTKDTIVNANLSVYPVWEAIVVPPTKYTVTFYDDENGNVFGTPIEVEEGKALGDNFPTATPAKDGYTFVKWVSGGAEFTKDTIVNANLSVYPLWQQIGVEPEEFTITFYDDKNGNVFGTPIVAEENTSLSDDFPTATPAKDGYTFVKWVYDTPAGPVEFTKDTIISGDMTIYPEWEEIVVPPAEYTVTFLTEKGGSVFATVEGIEAGTAIGQKFPMTVPQKPGFIFSNWIYEDGSSFIEVDRDTVVNCDMTVYAVYDSVAGPTTYTVTFYDDKGGNVFGTPIPVDEYTALGDDFPTATPTKDGYTFVKWVYDTPAGPVEFTKNTAVAENLDIYPVWEEIVVPPTMYTVTFYDDENGNVFGTPIEVEEGKALGDNFPTATPAKDGYTFVKWVSGGAEFTKDTIVNANLSVYPLWQQIGVEPEEFTITFYDDKNGNVFGTPIVAEENTSLGDDFPTATPTKDGYTFVKWVYDTPAGPVEFTKDTIISGDMTIYPEWEAIVVPPTMYTVTFYDDENGNVFGTPIEVEEGKALGDDFPTATPAKDGYTFVKWVSEGAEFTKDTVVNADLSVYPEWEEIVVPPTMYTVTFLTEKDGSVFATVEGIEAGTALGRKFPVRVPQKPGFEFTKWIYEAEGTFTDVTPETIVNCDMTVYAVYDEITEPEEYFNVTFYEYGWLDVHTTEVVSGATVPTEEIDTAYALLCDPTEKGYEANMDEESYISDETVARIHEIEGTWYYVVDGKLEIFDETVVVESDLEVYYYFNTMYALVNLESFFGPMGNYKFEAPFAQDTMAVESVIDLLWLNRASIKTIAKLVTDPFLGKTIKVGNLFEYTPVAENGEIMNAVYDYKLIDLLGESTVREFTTEAVANLVKNDREILLEAIEQKLDICAEPQNYKERAIIDDFIASDDVVKAEFISLAERLIKRDRPEWTDQQVEYYVDVVMQDRSLRLDLIKEAFANDDLREEVEQVIADEALTRLAAEEECEFTDYIVAIAEAQYEDEIETFIHQLKNNDAYLINYEDEDTDRRFIISAVARKLQATNLDTIKDKLPSFIFKILDEDKTQEIFDNTLSAYIEEVEAVRAAVWADDYDGRDYWVSSYVPVIINPIDDILIPTYDKAMGKLDSKLPGVEFYNANPYLAEIEKLIHYNELIVKVSSPSEGASGYAIMMDGNSIDADAYYSLFYKFVILGYDAIDWTLTNVPEEKLDDTINLIADRLGGYYEKLTNKFSQLNNGKVEKIRDKAYDFLAKAVAKDTSSVWGTVTPTFFDEKLDKVYVKGVKLVLEKSGFDVTETITVTIADDFKSVTLIQGEKIVTKTVPDIAKDIEKAGHTVSVNGTVITVDGNFEIDVVDYAKKITNKFGDTFSGRFFEDTDSLEAIPEILRSYILEINSDYVKLQIRLK